MTDFEVDGFYGMDDQIGGARDPNLAVHILNMYPEDPTKPSNLIPRPGIQVVRTSPADPSDDCNAVGSFIRATDNTIVHFAVIGGEIYNLAEILNSDDTLTRVVTSANFSTASVTRTTATTWYWTEYLGEIVFNDGTNQPFMWDGTSGAGGLTLLTNAPSSAVGEPTVYYGKLFFIKSDNVIVWSEENDANTGYEASGYNNTWALSQTSSQPLYNIKGTNDGLYYFREESVGVIRGAVTTTFSTTGVHDAIPGLGTISLAGVAFTDNKLFWFDPVGRAMALPLGGEAIPLWKYLKRFHGSQATSTPNPFNVTANGINNINNLAYAPNYFITVNDATKHVLFWYTQGTAGTDIPQTSSAAVFSTDSLQCHGFWYTGSTATKVQAAAPATLQSGTGSISGLIVGVDVQGTNVRIARMGGFDGYEDLWTYAGSNTHYESSAHAFLQPKKPTKLVYYMDRIDVRCNIPTQTGSDADFGVDVSCEWWSSSAPTTGEHTAAQTQRLSQTDANAAAIRQVPGRAVFGVDDLGRWFVPKIRLRRYDASGDEDAKEDVSLYGVSAQVTPVSVEPDL